MRAATPVHPIEPGHPPIRQLLHDGPVRPSVALGLVLFAVALGIATFRPDVLPWASRAMPDFRPFVMTIEEWDAARMQFADGRTAGGIAIYRLEYHRRDHWSLTLVSDELGGVPRQGNACRDGTYGSIDVDGVFHARSTDSGFCNGVSRWIRPGMACCYRWRKEIANGRVTYYETGERVIFDLETGLPVLYEAGPAEGGVSSRTVYRLERWL